VLNDGSLSLRFIAPLYQQTCYYGVSVERKLGLPEKPKRPLGAYFLFAKAIRPELKSRLPGVSPTGQLHSQIHLLSMVL